MVNPADFLGGGVYQMNRPASDPIGSGVGKRASRFGEGLWDSINGGKLEQVDRQYAELDAGSRGLIDRAHSSSMDSPEDVANQLMGNAGGAQSLLANENDFNSQDIRLGGASPEGMNRAISQRASQGFDRDMSKLKNASRVGAYGELSDRMGTSFHRSQTQNAIQQGAYAARTQYDQDRKNQRQAIINGVFGLGGEIGGYFAGGAAGASAGKSMGQKAYGGGGSK